MRNEEYTQLLEAILFIENKPIIEEEIQKVLNISNEQLSVCYNNLVEKYLKIKSSLEVTKEGKYICLKLKTEFLNSLREIYKKSQEKKLSDIMISVLGIIAYKGPLTKIEVDKIRGVDSGYIIKRLLNEELIELAGKKNIIGSPNLYRVSDKFFAFFQIESISELPNIEDFQKFYSETS